MKKRVRKVANFLVFNLLFFALYLNFIQQDKQGVLNVDKNVPIATAAAAFSGTILVEHPEKYLDQHAGSGSQVSERTLKSETAKTSNN